MSPKGCELVAIDVGDCVAVALVDGWELIWQGILRP